MNNDLEGVRHVATEPYLRETANKNHTMLAEAAKADPGEWYAIDTNRRPNVANIKNGIPGAFGPAGSFDARSTKINNFAFTLFVKYLGEAGQ